MSTFGFVGMVFELFFSRELRQMVALVTALLALYMSVIYFCYGPL